MKLELYCACGNIAEGEIRPDIQAANFRLVWAKVHSDSGCRPCSKDEALAAMNPEDRPCAPKETK